jgi:hypothetical protein
MLATARRPRYWHDGGSLGFSIGRWLCLQRSASDRGCVRTPSGAGQVDRKPIEHELSAGQAVRQHSAAEAALRGSTVGAPGAPRRATGDGLSQRRWKMPASERGRSFTTPSSDGAGVDRLRTKGWWVRILPAAPITSTGQLHRRLDPFLFPARQGSAGENDCRHSSVQSPVSATAWTRNCSTDILGRSASTICSLPRIHRQSGQSPNGEAISRYAMSAATAASICPSSASSIS